MTSKDDYSWMEAYAAKWISEQHAAEAAAKKPRFTLVTHNERPLVMETDTETTPAIQKLPHVDPHIDSHGAFNDLYASTRLLDLGTDALRGIAAMMEPATERADEQLDNARRSEVSAVFRFFSETLKSQATIAYESAERLQRAAQGELV